MLDVVSEMVSELVEVSPYGHGLMAGQGVVRR